MTASYPTARVGIARSDNRRTNVYNALDRIRDDVTPVLAEEILLKPNFLSATNQLASTHADAIRGVIDFTMSTPKPPQRVLVAEGGNEERSGQAFEEFGYEAIADEYDVQVDWFDLNQETRWETEEIELADGTPYTVHIPRTVLDSPCTISVAVAKTHDVCVVTLALKNMIMGTIRKDDRVKMHGFRSHAERELPTEARRLNVNLMRLSQHLKPNVAIVDGTEGLQGNGPGGTDVVDLGFAAAGVDVFAVDAVVTKAMGFEPAEQGILHYAQRLEVGIADLERIEVLGEDLDAVIRSFLPHESTDQQLMWRDPSLEWQLPR
ncbi:MAG: DUF362 domain-containing protein [Candidatus Latescibacterota bacterium]|nr:DUF362 domain-containing protein [Candidatus Latescibacterota bacterium]